MGDLFERVKTNKLPYKAEDLPKQATKDYILPCLTSSFQNQGLNYFAPKEGATVLSHVISLPSNSDVYRAYYQSREFTVLSDAYAIRWKSTNRVISPNQYLFVVMCINKVTDLPIYQELRNCMYRGNLNDAAKELCEENKVFLEILKQKKPHQRYLDVEFIIRYFAFSDNIAKDEMGNVCLNGYRGKLVQFLNEYMDLHKDCSLEEKQSYKDRFNATIEKIVIVFGTEKAFRDISADNTKIYKTIADFIMPSFERMSKEYIESNKDLIYSRLVNFLKIDEIQDSISKRTSDRDIVNLRLRMWFKEFEDVISL